jgi:predicted amidohydrolase YtcJ
LLTPYSDAPHTKGLLFHTPAELQGMIRTAASRGYQVNVHAIGDAANREVLDAFAALPPQWRAARRHRIEHAQVVALEDMPRFVKLGLIPSMQPVHATSDMNMAEHRVGPQRIRGAYAWQRFTKLGARIACGSDFPIESPNPFEGMLAAVSRTDLQGQPQGGWYPIKP